MLLFAAELRRRSFGRAGSDTGTGAGGDLSHNLSESCISNISSSSLRSDPNALPSKMSADGKKQPPPYIIPVESQGDGVRVYHPHTPFTPPTTQESTASSKPVYTSGGGGVGSGFDSGEGKKKFVSYDTSLGTESGMTTCSSCQQQVMTNVTYKAGTYAWLMCLLFICCGLVLCCCLIPFFMNRFKDAYHTCPRCNRVLHVEKRKCCK